MARPNLLNAVPVTVELFTPADTVYDEDAREPIHGARAVSTTTVKIMAQVTFPQYLMPQYSPAGTRMASSGFITCSRAELMDAGITIKRNDRIIQIGTGRLALPVSLYITGLAPLGHYWDQGGPTLIRYLFEDRESTEAGPV